MKNILKKSIILNKVFFYLGYLIFKIFGKTPRIFYMSMVNLYCLTNGRFLDNLKPRHKYIFNSNLKSTLFNELDFEYVKTISQTIEKDGYSIFKNKLDNKVIDELK